MNFANVQEDFRIAFQFLVNRYDFQLEDVVSDKKGFACTYAKEEIRIRLVYDYRDNFFYFNLIRGSVTSYPNDQDQVNIRTFVDLFQKRDSQVDVQFFQPSSDDYKRALMRNSEMLEARGHAVLMGESWI